MREARPMGLFQ